MRGIVSECAALSVLAGLAVLSAGGPGPPEPRSRPAITVSPQTTYLTSPLNPDGTVNYVAAINAVYGRGVTPDNNAAIPMIRAFGPDVLKEETRREVFARLQMPAAPQKGGYFQDLGSYLSARKAAGIAVQDDSLALSEKVDRAGKAFWTAEDHPFLAEWIQANAGPLAVLVLATKRPRFYVPWVSNSRPPTCSDSFDTFHWHKARQAAKALAARAMLRAGSGQFDAAAGDLLAVHRLARLLGQGPVLLDHLVARGVEALACHGDAVLAGSPRMTGGQARAHLAALHALPPLPPTAEVLETGERLFGLDSWARSVREGAGKDLGQTFALLGIPVELPPDMPVDWDELLRMSNSRTDLLVAACRRPTFRERREAAERLRADVEAVVGKTEEHRVAYARKLAEVAKQGAPARRQITRALFYLTVSLGAISGRAAELRDEVVMRKSLAEVALALRVYQAENARFPAALDQLKPSCLKDVPRDIFVDKPLIYRPQGNGYLLYSVGENMKDDGGKTAGPEGDLALRVEG